MAGNDTPKVVIPPEIVRASLAGAEANGLDTAALLARSRIPVPLSADGSPVSALQFGRLLLMTSKAMGDEASGFLRRPLPVGTFAIFCHSTITARTLRQALQRAGQFLQVMDAGFSASIDERGDEARLTLHFHGDVPDQYFIESLFIILVRWSSWMIDATILLNRVGSVHSAPAYVDEYDRMFPGAHYFDQDECLLVFPRRYLDMRVVQDPVTLEAFLKKAPGNLLHQYRNDISLSGRVRKLIAEGDRPDLTLDQASDRLALSPATLRRRLRAEGSTFQDIKDQVRKDHAVYLLAHDNLSIYEVAEQLGFSEASTFHRAFRKWTGMAPGEFRDTRDNIGR